MHLYLFSYECTKKLAAPACYCNGSVLFYFCFFVFGSIVVQDSNQSGCIPSFRHLLNACNSPFLIFLFPIICFIVSAFTPSVPAALPFFLSFYYSNHIFLFHYWDWHHLTPSICSIFLILFSHFLFQSYFPT